MSGAARVRDAVEAVRALKQQIKEMNMIPEYIVVSAVEKRDGKWVVEFTYLLTTYVAEISEDGRMLSLKRKGLGL